MNGLSYKSIKIINNSMKCKVKKHSSRLVVNFQSFKYSSYLGHWMTVVLMHYSFIWSCNKYKQKVSYLNHYVLVFGQKNLYACIPNLIDEVSDSPVAVSVAFLLRG